MENEGLQIRAMGRHELEPVLDWAALEGWNPGLHDAACFYQADPGGFLVGLRGDEPVASIFAVRYGTGFGFIGGYIVKPAWRGKGYGMALWQAGMARLTGRTIGLDGVLAQQANYARSGFALAHRNIRFEGRGCAHEPAGSMVVPLASLPVGEVLRYDQAFFADERSSFLRCWIGQAGSIALGVGAAGRLLGYCVMRPCRQGFKIGPLFADTPELAEALLADTLGRVPADVPVFLDVPEPNADALALAARHQMQACFETARMYRLRR